MEAKSNFIYMWLQQNLGKRRGVELECSVEESLQCLAMGSS